MISDRLPRIPTVRRQAETAQYSFWGRLAFIGTSVVAAGWLWPYELSSLPSNLGSTGWVLGWFTFLVLIGAACGYTLRSRWAVLIAPLGLYVGGVIHWFQFEWGLHEPPWTMFALVSGTALVVLLITTGAGAGIAVRVLAAQSAQARPSDGIRMSAALAALLGLLAITTVSTLPTPFVGAIFGLAALLSGAGLMEEKQVNVRERILAIAGMLVGVVAIGSQLLSLWSLLKNFIL